MREIVNSRQYKQRVKIKSVRRHGIGYGKKWSGKLLAEQLGSQGIGLRFSNA